MGAGSTKPHEASTVTPSTNYSAPANTTPPPAAGAGAGEDLVAGKKWETTEDAPTAEMTGPDNQPDPGSQQDPDIAAVGELAEHPVHDQVPGLDEAWASTEPLAGLPETLSPMDATATSVLVAGGDFENANLSLAAYHSGDGQIEVLYGWVHPDAEAKILDAIIDQDGLVEVTEPAMVYGQLDVDTETGFHKELVTAVKSIKHHTNAGSSIPAHTQQRLAELVALREELASHDDAAVALMLAHYGPALDASVAVANGSGTTDQIGMVTVFETNHEAQLTTKVPAKALGPTGPDLVGNIKPASRPKIVTDTQGRTLLSERQGAGGGQEYEIELGGGFLARYRPHNDSNVSSSKGMQGLLEIHAPPGAGHHEELVGRLAQLNLHNKPLTAAEAEHTYLLRNAWAQGVDQAKSVRTAIDSGHTLAGSYAELIASERSQEAVGLNQAEMVAWAKRIRLEADTAAAPMRTSLLRDAVATQLGFTSGAAMAATNGYDPMPTREGPTHVWSRFDIAATSLGEAWSSKRLVHKVTGNNLSQLLTSGSGVFAATEHRRFMGAKNGLGMSEAADVGTGGSRSVFLRVKPKSANYGASQWLEWDQPAQLLSRSDWYAYNSDQFGKFTNGSNQTRNPNTLVSHNAHNNEVMFRDGIDLFGPHGPDRIHLGSKTEASKVISTLKASGRTHIRNQPLEEVIVP